jgi:hypothetical protein
MASLTRRWPLRTCVQRRRGPGSRDTEHDRETATGGMSKVSVTRESVTREICAVALVSVNVYARCGGGYHQATGRERRVRGQDRVVQRHTVRRDGRAARRGPGKRPPRVRLRAAVRTWQPETTQIKRFPLEIFADEVVVLDGERNLRQSTVVRGAAQSAQAQNHTQSRPAARRFEDMDEDLPF